MKIAVVIIHFGKLETTKNCLKQLSKKIGDHQVIVINNTPDDCKVLTAIIPRTKYIDSGSNVGFAKAVNAGIKLALKDKNISHVLLMNNDLAISFGSLNQLLQTYNRYGQAGIVAPVLHHAGGFDWGGKYNRWSGMVKHKNWGNKPKTIQTVDHVAGAAMLISRTLFDKIELFDERFFLYFEDIDFCIRARQASFTLHINPDVVAEHLVSAGSNPGERTAYQWKSHFQFVTKHLFKYAFPTAYIYDALIYPIWVLKEEINDK